MSRNARRKIMAAKQKSSLNHRNNPWYDGASGYHQRYQLISSKSSKTRYILLNCKIKNHEIANQMIMNSRLE
jgi:hypothetical protein